MIAHVGGLPLEELAPVVLGAGGGLLLVGRAWVTTRLRHARAEGRLGDPRGPRGRD